MPPIVGGVVYLGALPWSAVSIGPSDSEVSSLNSTSTTYSSVSLKLGGADSKVPGGSAVSSGCS